VFGSRKTAEGVALSGEIDLLVSESFAADLLAGLEGRSGVRRLIDLTEITFIDSTGLSALIRTVGQIDRPITILTSRSVFLLLRVAGLTDGRWTGVEVCPPPELA
jgi:anti-anti-sigma factor